MAEMKITYDRNAQGFRCYIIVDSGLRGVQSKDRHQTKQLAKKDALKQLKEGNL